MALVGSIDLAIDKATTARIFDKTTSDLGRASQPGAPFTHPGNQRRQGRHLRWWHPGRAELKHRRRRRSKRGDPSSRTSPLPSEVSPGCGGTTFASACELAAGCLVDAIVGDSGQCDDPRSVRWVVDPSQFGRLSRFDMSDQSFMSVKRRWLGGRIFVRHRRVYLDSR